MSVLPGAMPRIEFVAIGENEDGTPTHRVLDCDDANSRGRLLPVPFAAAAGGRPFWDNLAKAGVMVPLSAKTQREVLRILDGQHPTKRVIIASQLGWLKGTHFVLPHRIIGPNPDSIMTDLGDELVANSKFGTSCDIGQWQKTVAALALGNDLVMVAIMTAFTGPIMALLGTDTGVINLVGESSTGKSTAMVAGGSVWGGQAATLDTGRLGFIDTWLTTANALDVTLAAHNDGFLGLDDTGFSADSQDAARSILAAAYRVSGGEEKARRTDVGRRNRWRTMVMSSSEETLDQLALRARTTVNLGQRVRFIDIDANGGKGWGVFQELHDDTDSATFSRRLRDASLEHFGVAGELFLERLTADLTANPQEVVKFLREMHGKYRHHMLKEGAGGLESRITDRFAAIYAAGRLAIRYGLLPWQTGDCAKAVTSAHRKMVPLPATALRQADPVQVVRDYIKANQKDFLRLDNWKGTFKSSDLADAKGLLRTARGGSVEYLFSSKHFQQDVCAPYSGRSVVQALRNANLINMQSGGKSVVRRDFPAPLEQAWVISIREKIMK